MTLHRHNLYLPRYWLGWTIVGLLRFTIRLPLRWQLAIGKGMGRMLERLAKRQRCIVQTNLKLCFPDLGEAARGDLQRRSFESIGIMLIEMALAWWGSESRIRNLLEGVEGEEHLAQLRNEGRGVILLSAHFTTLEIGGRLFRTRCPLNVSYRADRNPFVDHFLRQGREALFENVIPRDDVRALIRCLREGNVLWFAPDENYPRDNRVVVDFMGVPAASNPATGRFARLGNAAVVPFAALRRTDGIGYRIVLLPPLENFPSGDPVADTERVNEALSALVRVAPEQYLWVQKRFLHGPDGQLSTYDHC